MKHLNNKNGKETDNCDGTKGNDEVYEVLDNYNIYDVPPEKMYSNDDDLTRVNGTLYDNVTTGTPTETLYDNGTEGDITLTDPDAVLLQHATYEVMNPPAADIYDDVMGHETSTVLSNKLALQKDECDDYDGCQDLYNHYY